MHAAELCALTNFTFLTGAAHPEEMVEAAHRAGLSALAVTDVNSVAGVVRAHQKMRDLRRVAEGVPRVIPGARLVLQEGFAVTALPRDRAAWGRLCRLLTTGQARAPKGHCHLRASDLLEWGEGLEFLLHPPGQRLLPAEKPLPAQGWEAWARGLAARFPGQSSLVLAPHYDGQDGARMARHAALAARLGLPVLASSLPMLHHPSRRRLADVLTAIRLGLPVTRLGRAALPHAEQRLRGPEEMARLFAGHEAALAHAAEVAARAAFSLDELRYEYPSEVAAGESPAQRLRRLAEEGLRHRYPQGVPPRARAQMDHELTLIARLGYEPYFLTVNDIVAFARSRGILCQ